MLALIIPLGDGSQLPIPPVPPGGIATPPIYYPPHIPIYPGSRPPVDPGYGQGTPIPPHIPIYPGGPVDPGFGVRPPVDPGWGQGHPLPPGIWPGRPPVDPGWGQGHPMPPGTWPGRPPIDPGWGQGHPLPPHVGGGPIYPQPPAPPDGGHIEVPISGGWSLQYVRGVGWVLVPPPQGVNPPGTATPPIAPTPGPKG
jgi:hypothetical protein